MRSLETETKRGFEIERGTGGASRHSAPPDPVGRSAASIIAVASEKRDSRFHAILERIYRETDQYLQGLARAVSEGRAVVEANNYLRWLQFSGVCMLLEHHQHLDEGFVTLRKKADDLQELCKPHLQGRNIKEPPSQSRIDEVNAKVDLILTVLANKATVTVEPLPLKQIGQGVSHE